MSDTRILVPSELFACAESSYFEGTYDLNILKTGPDLYEFACPLAWQVTVTNTGGALLVTGTVEGTAKTSCARCLGPFEFPLTGEIEGYFLLSDEEEAPEDMEDDEFEYLPKDNVIDLDPLIRAALLLELPLVPLCDEDCKGICPDCGADLNEGPCDCEKQSDGAEGTETENPFAVLKDFPFEK
ncbi:YceD family protein [Raoultibacter phocaeensis]|uniref:YceD family protein n=1 Tax=Raoultibacter phocaeensis TaxID=2479841 RepID=UPI00111B79E5|nr:DUF177 domain-containing protein [Raoultibacter phocaeensis]